MDKSKFALLTNDIVERNLINLHQITFEVTDACNLKCKYCAYGEYYSDYDERTSKYLPVKRAIKLLLYLEELWDSSHSSSYRRNTYISFYGGEPLLNMPFIREIVEWIDSRRNISKCNFVFTMTTNAMLLDKHIDFLVKHNFKILISLDGNEYNQSYRVDHAGNNSFRKVFTNVKYVQENFPQYFRDNISFNSVLHNRNNYLELINFFSTEFNKLPKASELNMMGIRPELWEEFSQLFQSRMESLDKSSKDVIDTILMDHPVVSQLCSYIHWRSGNVFKSYNDLLVDDNKKKWVPTGTCRPFEKKLFVTVNGKILPCERISHEYDLGYVDEEHVTLDIDEIVKKYNGWYEKYIPQCSGCFNNLLCQHCMFNNPNLKDTCSCDSFMNKKIYDNYVEGLYNFLSKTPHLYKRIMEEVIIH